MQPRVARSTLVHQARRVEVKSVVELSRVSDYAVRAVLYLSLCGEQCRTKDIAEAMLIPRAYLSKVLQELAKRNIVRLKPGVGGGVTLAVNPAELSVLDVIQAVEGRLAFSRCVYAPGECELSGSCPVHMLWCRLQSQCEGLLGGMTFAELAAGCSTDAFEKTRAHGLEVHEPFTQNTRIGGKPCQS